MATPIYGYDGNFVATGLSGRINAWTFNIAVNAIDVTAFGYGSGYRDFVEGCKAATCTATGFATTGSGQAPITSFDNGSFEISSVVLTAATGCVISGSGLATSITIERPVCDTAKISFNINFHGKPSITWA